jgi:very-short-patch-repair endonuclease
LDRSAVARRVAAGRLHRLHRGVYAVGHPGVSLEGRWMAAVLASGTGAALSHGSAAVHWGLLRPLSGPIDVSVPTGAGRARRAGIRLHRRQALERSDVTRHRGIPATTPARTVADLKGTMPPRLARRARRQAEVLGFPLGGLCSDRSRSDLEAAFLGLCRRHGLPSPQVNARVGRWTVDFLWLSPRLVVETDGYLYHRGSIAFEDDRERVLGLRVLGYDVLCFTGRHVSAEPERVAALVGDALRSRGADRAHISRGSV